MKKNTILFIILSLFFITAQAHDIFTSTDTTSIMSEPKLYNSKSHEVMLKKSLASHPDYAALKMLYDTLSGTSWTTNTGWLSGCDPCEGNAGNPWHGINCEDISGTKRVTSIILNTNNLQGQWTNVDLSTLAELKVIILFENNITGGWNNFLNGLSKLTILNLNENLNLGGSLPSDIGLYFPDMEQLRFWKTNLSGEIPSSIGLMQNLTGLSLDNNNLSGGIPATFANLKNLTAIWLKSNNMSGCYHPTLRNLCGITGDISTGNNFNADWSEFCSYDAGTCCYEDVKFQGNGGGLLSGAYSIIPTYGSVPSGIYQGNSTTEFHFGNQVENNADVTVRGSSTIILEDGFEVPVGAVLQVENIGCIVNY